MIVAQHGAGSAIIRSRRALRYADGGDPSTGRPPHVRAASGLAWQARGGERVLIAPQDDTSFLAVLAPPDGDVSAITLDYAPHGLRVFEKRTHTKELKLDLEAIAAIDDARAIAIGSGSHENRRRMVVIDANGPRVITCEDLYEALRARREFAGSELNIEGAARVGDRFCLANRGNGAAISGQRPVDAIAEISLGAFLAYLEGHATVPPLLRVTELDLGSIAGGRLTFTDLAPGPNGDLFFLASAERSPNAYDDGEVVGAAIGIVRLDEARASIVPIVESNGTPARIKPEGLALAGFGPSEAIFYACVDADDPDVASDLITIAAPLLP